MFKSRLCCMLALFFVVADTSLAEQVIPVVSPLSSTKINAAPLMGISGIVKSRGRDNLYWVVKGSSNEARIFAINDDGNTVIPTYSKFSYFGEQEEPGKQQWQGFTVLFAQNQDWRDMAVDERFLYIADTGNKANDRQDLGIYVISEIDPTASTQSAAIKHLPVRYPEQQSFPAENWHFDADSLFSADGKLYLVTKHRQKGSDNHWQAGANLYRLDTDYTDQDNVLSLIDSHPSMTAATSAEVSPDGQRLAVLAQGFLWLFDKPGLGDAWLSSSSSKLTLNLDHDSAATLETLTWKDNASLWLGNSERELFYVNPAELLAAP